MHAGHCTAYVLLNALALIVVSGLAEGWKEGWRIRGRVSMRRGLGMRLQMFQNLIGRVAECENIILK
jgi:hypothetical protein